MRISALALLIPALFALTLTACGETPLASPAPDASPSEKVEETVEPTADPEMPTNDELLAFVEAIASEKTASLEEAESLVQEESPAAGYLKYYAHNINAQIDAGIYFSDVSSTVEEVDGGFSSCSDVLGEKECIEYTEFEGKDGLLVNFEVEGRNLEDRLVMGSGEAVPGVAGSELEFISAYMNASDSHLIVSYDMTSGGSGLEMPAISYRGEDGRQSQAEEHYGSWSLAPDSKSSYVAYFPNASLGGEIHVEMWTSDVYEDMTVVLPTVVE